MNPDIIHVQPFCHRKQFFLLPFINSDLRNFPQIDIAGMNIYNKIGTCYIINDAACYVFNHRALRITRENTVHVQIKHRYLACYGIHSQRIQARINIHYTVPVFGGFIKFLLQTVADILSFQFVTVYAADDADAPLGITAYKTLFFYHIMFIYR